MTASRPFSFESQRLPKPSFLVSVVAYVNRCADLCVIVK